MAFSRRRRGAHVATSSRVLDVGNRERVSILNNNTSLAGRIPSLKKDGLVTKNP